MSLNDPAAPPSPPNPSAPRTVSLTLFVVVILVVAGAGVIATAGYYALRPATHSSPGTITVTDDLGRTVQVPVDPSRVAVLSPSIMDVMFRLGLRSHVVGVDCYAPNLGGLSADYSPDQVNLWNLSSSMCVQVGPSFDAESLVNVTPQLVLASTIVSVAAVEEISTTLGIPVVMLQPPTLSGILVDVSLVGEIFGVNSTAAQLNAQLTTELYNATNFTSSLPSLPTVLVTYSLSSDGYWTFGPTSFGESLIEVAGAANIGANATVPYPVISAEQVLVSDPSWIVYATGFGLNESYYASGLLWSEFPAVKDGNVTGVNSNWLTEPDPTMILVGLPALLTVLHPGDPS
jgi:ABC-type Fe3+-hydroxamate transport system substrate-binding protein